MPNVPCFVPEKVLSHQFCVSLLNVTKNLVEFRWNNILTEMRECALDVLDFMATVAIPKLKGNNGRQVMPFCTAYGILMNVRCRELSLVQKINAVLLGVGGATKKGQSICNFLFLANDI